MKAKPYPAKTISMRSSTISVLLALLVGTFLAGLFAACLASAQTTQKKTGVPNNAGSDVRDNVQNNVPRNVEQELVRIETGFFEAWKARDQAYFREHMPEGGVFWGESGTLSREQELAEQQAAAKVCSVEGYGLSEFGVLPLTSGAYLLTYKAEQYATCEGVKMPIHVNGSSIYVLKAGRWQAIYRAAVALKNQS